MWSDLFKKLKTSGALRLLSSFVRRACGGLGLAALAIGASAQTVTYFHNDPAGTPVLATDAAGDVVWKENYRPYGDRLNSPAAQADR